MHAHANTLQSEEENQTLLDAVQLPSFISSWRAVLAIDGCVMAVFTCARGCGPVRNLLI